MFYRAKSKHPDFNWVCIPEKYVLKTIEDKEDLAIALGEGKMTIDKKKIGTSIKGYSEYQKDQFGRGDYRLAFFAWKPEEIGTDKELSAQSL